MDRDPKRKPFDGPGIDSPAKQPAADSPFPSAMPDGREFCPCFESRRLARRINGYYEARIGPLGLTSPQFSLLGFLLARPGSSIRELAQMLDVDRTTVSRNLALMLRQELVIQAPDPADGRRRSLRATPAGKLAWRAGLAAWRAAQDDFKREIGGAAAFAGLIGLMRQTSAGLPQAEAPEPGPGAEAGGGE